jgi:hypothetical protein
MLDTASDISIGRIEFLENIRLARKTTTVQGVGGEGVFEVEGDFSLDEKHFLTLFASAPSELPPGIVALIENKHLAELSVSLDYAQAHPGAPLQDAIAFGSCPREGAAHLGLRTPPLAGLAVYFLISGSATGLSVVVETLTFIKVALSLFLSLLVWMVLQWVHTAPLSNARPPVRDGAMAQALTSLTDRKIQHALCPPRSHLRMAPNP